MNQHPTERLTVAISVPDVETSVGWTMLRHSLRRAAGSAMTLLELPAASAAAQVESLQDLAPGHADILLISPLSTDASLAAVLASQQGAGTRVVALDAIAALAAAHQAGQQLAALHVLDSLDDAGRVVYLAGESAQKVYALRTAGWQQALARYPHLACLHNEFNGKLSCLTMRQYGAHQIAALHAQDQLGSVAAIVAADDDMALGAIDALAAAGLAGRIPVAGYGATPEALLAIGKGSMCATVRLDPRAYALALLALACHGSTGQLPAAPMLVSAANLDAALQADAHTVGAMLSETVGQVRKERVDSRFMHAAIDNLPVMVYIKEARGLRYEFINKARETWLGQPRRNVLGKTAYDFNPKELADHYTAKDRYALASRGVVDQPAVPILMKSGETEYMLTRKIPLFDARGEPEFLVCIQVDVTARKLAEEGLARRNSELEAAHAALKDHQHKLLVSEKMAALGRLTAGIAHEMNTPLAAIRAAMSELQSLVREYEDSVLDPQVTAEDHAQIAGEMRRSVELAQKSAERAAGFVRSVKHYTRDLQQQKKIVFNATQVIQESVFLLDHALKQRRCRVEVEASAPAIDLRGTPGGFSQIVTNLVNNAIDACPADGSGHIRISLKAGSDEVQLAVQDNGGGIDQNNITRIFDPMFTTKPFGKGTGLGLAIVHEVVTLEFNGDIDVASEPGQGARFTLRFPPFMEGCNSDGT